MLCEPPRRISRYIINAIVFAILFGLSGWNVLKKSLEQLLRYYIFLKRSIATGKSSDECLPMGVL
jgi:hypothetical protein